MDLKLRDVLEMPEGGVYTGGIAVFQYMDADGDMCFAYKHDLEEMPISTTLGLLELAKMDLRAACFSDDD